MCLVPDILWREHDALGAEQAITKQSPKGALIQNRGVLPVSVEPCPTIRWECDYTHLSSSTRCQRSTREIGLSTPFDFSTPRLEIAISGYISLEGLVYYSVGNRR
ncbi:hypothetical protein OPQ81_001365 [Rhizoctonia solani]|nr:hypothetical protein OPQ81_001365 [Rhizoctonia solani]